jgi:hypothetical protein
MSGITKDSIKAATGCKVKFKTDEELYALLAYLSSALAPKKEAKAPKESKAPKEPKEPKAPKAKAAKLLEPVDADAESSTSAPTLGATDALRANKYRVQVLNPALCVARKIDEDNPLAGSRPDDEGSKGKIFPELQCSKKPVAGCLLCTTCAKKEAEYLADPSKPLKRWYGRLDEPMYDHALVVGCEAFYKKYPAGLPDAPVSAPAEKPKKASKAAKVAAVVEEMTAAEPAATKEPKKAKKAKAPKAEEPATTQEPATTEPVAEAVDEAPKEPATAKKAKAPKAKPAAKPTASDAEDSESEPESEAEPKPKAKAPAPESKVKKSVSVSSSARSVEWVTFMSDGVPLIRHTGTGNVYQCDTSKHTLEEMVCRDKYEGKWRDGALDAYIEEDEE